MDEPVIMKHSISSPDAPAAIGPYSQGIRIRDFVYLAGQIPVDPATGELAGPGIREQTARCLANIKALLMAEGLTLDDVIKTTVFMVDLNDFAAMNEVYAAAFPSPYPARSTVQVAALPKGARVEIEVVAHR
ncbi:MAG: RidA family protein [Candidatus Methylacidiphilales bacterium]